jgi:hypothetical protein
MVHLDIVAHLPSTCIIPIRKSAMTEYLESNAPRQSRVGNHAGILALSRVPNRSSSESGRSALGLSIRA